MSSDTPDTVELLRQQSFNPKLLPAAEKGASIGSEALSVLLSFAWPGNLRELQEVLRGACAQVKGERIELADLPFHLKHTSLPAERRLPLDTLLEQVERRLIALALKLTEGNHTHAAELLEIWRPRLLRRLEKFGQDDQQARG